MLRRMRGFNARLEQEGLVPLGPRALKGHSPVEAFGWRPADDDMRSTLSEAESRKHVETT
jgi:hypothetical protein